MNRILYKTTF